MGQKTHPIGFRLGVTKTWSSRWYAERKQYGDWLEEDLRIKEFIKKEMPDAMISQVEIERAVDRIKAIVITASPGRVIGKRGAKVEELKKKLEELIRRRREAKLLKRERDLRDLTKRKGSKLRMEPMTEDAKKRYLRPKILIEIQEVRTPETDAQLVAENVARQLERRVAYRRAMKKALQNAMRMGAKGIKIQVAGRLGGAEMSRREWYLDGRVPLHTLRADIDYGFAIARTTYGVIGVKCWIYKGDVLTPRGGNTGQ